MIMVVMLTQITSRHVLRKKHILFNINQYIILNNQLDFRSNYYKFYEHNTLNFLTGHKRPENLHSNTR